MNRRHTLQEMHTYCRPHGSSAETLFLDRFVWPLPGATADAYGNIHVTIGEAPTVLYSCHTDTVHRIPGRQGVTITPAGLLTLSKRSRRHSSCLGADDTVGVFLCREMILAKRPGHYVFHYGEEAGCIGSRDLAEYGPELLTGIRSAIAFDRAGVADVITHQMGRRCCSDAFALALAAHLSHQGLAYVPSSLGLYTDTESYAELVPECTNVSVGYSAAHSAREAVDVAHVGHLLHVLLTLDASTLPIERDPAARRTPVYVPYVHGLRAWDTWPDDDDPFWRDVDSPPIERRDSMYLNLDLPAIERQLAEDRETDDYWRASQPAIDADEVRSRWDLFRPGVTGRLARPWWRR